MTAHDPLCSKDLRLTLGTQMLCDCALIARVRADEREKVAQEIEAQATTQECISLRTTGPALPPDINCGCWVCADHRLVGRFAAIARGGDQ